MQRPRAGLRTILLGVACAIAATGVASASQQDRAYRVRFVADGDTIGLASGKQVRLVQIDAPEFGRECYGKKAGMTLRELLPFGTRVRLQRDPRLENVDRFGRLLRYVFKGEQNINLALVRQGAASAYFLGRKEGRYADELRRATDHARAERRGAWGACNASYDLGRAWDVRYKDRR